MKRGATPLVPLLLLAARTAYAQAIPDLPLAPRAAQLEAIAHFGVATSPFPVTSLREAKGQAFLLMATGRYALSESLAFELRAPFVLGSVAQPAGSYVDASALGNPQLALRSYLLRRNLRSAALAWSATLGLGAPLASHAADLMPNRLLAIADGIEGRGRPDWFVPGVVPITPSTAVVWTRVPWTLGAELRLPWFVRVSEADLPETATNTRWLGLASVLELEARYRLSRRLSLAAAAHLAADIVSPAKRLPGVSPLQDFERLSLHVHFAARAALMVDLQTAVAGELGGNTASGGFRFALNLQ
jgi:hypothetical protein